MFNNGLTNLHKGIEALFNLEIWQIKFNGWFFSRKERQKKTDY
jgi:hypothetical protein